MDTVETVESAVDEGIRVASLDADSVARWDAFVEATPAAAFFHRAGWKEVIEKTFRHRCHFLYAEADGTICGVLPLVHVRSRVFANALVSTGFTVGGGPVAASPAALAALDRRALALAESLDVDFVEYRVRQPIHDDWARKSGLYAGFRKTIEADPEANMLAIPRKQRAMVRKGIKAGLESRVDTDTATLHRVYAESLRNLGTPVHPRSYFDNLLEVFGDAADIVTVTADGRPVASVMNFYFRDQVLPYYGGGRRVARALAANDFMYWEVMRRAGERGLSVFDFGRSKTGTGAYAFKKNWGFEPEPWTYEYKLRRVAEIPELNPLNPRYRLVIAAWKRLPLPVAKFIGPLVVRGLG